MLTIAVFLIIAFSTFVQTATGFGVALISTPLLIGLVGIHVAAPLVALIAMLCRLIMIIYYHHSFDIGEIWRVMIMAIIGVPFGFFLFITLDKHTVEVLLGVVVAGYAIYALISPKIPPMHDVRWAYGLGFISGVLGGAYNMGGMPQVIYGTGRRWSPLTFKGNLQLVALVTGVLIIITRSFNGEYTPDVLMLFLIGTPATLVGVLLGFWSDSYLKGMLFRRIVLLLMLIIGLDLIF